MLKRQELQTRKANAGMSPTQDEPSLNAVDPRLIALNDSAEWPHSPVDDESPTASQVPPSNAVLPLSDVVSTQDTPQPVLQPHPQGGQNDPAFLGAGSETHA